MDMLTNKKTTPCRITDENVVRTKIVKYLESKMDCKVERIEPNKYTRRRGLPDLLVMTKDSVKLLEVKTFKGKVSPFQKNVIEYIGNYNVCTVVYGYDVAYIDKFIKGEL